MTLTATPFAPPTPLTSALAIDPAAETERIVTALRAQLAGPLRRRGFVVGMSGGIDSSVCAALVTRAVGPRRVHGLFMPERHSDPISLRLATELATQLGISYTTEDIAATLEGAGCYERQAEAIRMVVPEFTHEWKFKIVLPGDRMNSNRINVSALVVQAPDGTQREVRLTAEAYRQIVAATNFKQRVRKMMEYYHADRLHYAVVGTPNRLEYDQGFFVKGGDGLADVKPIAHLYKTQVYQLAAYLGVPEGIRTRPPTTDTFSLPQSQEEFYFELPAAALDVALHALNNGIDPAETAAALGFTVEQVEHVQRDIRQKRVTTRYLHLGPQLVDAVPEIHLD